MRRTCGPVAPTVEQPRAIIDRGALAAEWTAATEDAGKGEAVRPQLLALLKQALTAGNAEIRARFEATTDGMAAARAQSFLTDQIVRLLFEVTTTRVYPAVSLTSAERLAVVAVGGYGRGEMAPFSDVDLLFLLPYKQTPWSEQVVEFMLYVLWDLGLAVGHAVRSVDESMALARADLTIRTSLLEARYVCGDAELYRQLRDRFDRNLLAGTGPQFVEAKLAERDARHRRMGDSRYLVEPNLKDGKGGLRDLHTLFWIAKYLYRVDAVSELVDRGVLDTAEARQFAKAEGFLWSVRVALHYLSGRPEERLTFDVQENLARRLGYRDHAGTRGVERLMKHYFLVAKDVGDLTRIFCAHLEAQHQRKSRFRMPRLGLRRRQIGPFVIDGDRVTVADPTLFGAHPVEMIRLFAVAQARGLDIHPEALRLITRNLKRIDERLRRSPEANALFVEILTSRKDPEQALRRMNEAGVVGALVRDFGRVVAQMQHDTYHIYTVDEHTIRAIGILSRIENGELAGDHPLSDEIIHKVLSRRVLYVALFLHDIAKGRGGDHSEIGATIAEKLCPRLGLSAAETETVAWLVRHHLLMSSVAFKRDIADPKTVSDFANRVKSPERLRLLLILTVADIRAVGPAVWNGWKGQLLRDLYYRAEEVLLGGHASIGSAEQRVAGAKRRLRARLTDWSDTEFDIYAARHFPSYWLSSDTESQVRDARLIRDADGDRRLLAIAAHVDDFRSITELTLYTADHPGLFASFAGALAVAGASIVDARIFSTSDGMAIDTFSIQDLDCAPISEAPTLAKLDSVIERTLAGEINPGRVLAGRRPLMRRTEVFTVAPRVLIDNKASDRYTVIEVNGRDRTGLLYDLTRALSDLSLTISSAHIATYGEQAVDVFYVRDLFGHKITHLAKLKRIETCLLDALRVPTRDAPASAMKAGRADAAVRS